MAANSSSMVISFSIAILLLLILLLLLSYKSKNKRDNSENFTNVGNNLEKLSLPDLSNPFDAITGMMSGGEKKENFNTSVANFDPYAKTVNADLGGIQPNDDCDDNYTSLNGSEKFNNKYTNFSEGFETKMAENPTTCLKKDKLTSQDLLPKDAQNLAWAKINPSSQANIKDQNFLTAGYHIGVNTVGQSLRNANLQLRSEIPNPQVAVSPWLISTIEPDVRATTLEIGSAPSY